MISVDTISIQEFRGIRNLTLEMKGATFAVCGPNLKTLGQENRQDLRHVQILFACCRHYLAEAYAVALKGEITERSVVERFSDTLGIVRAPEAKSLMEAHQLALMSAIPARSSLKDLARLPSLSAFYDHQLANRQTPRLGI